MKVPSNSTVTFALLTCAMFVSSCASDVETDTNIDPEGSAINFSPSVGHTTRATETNINNLGDFAVVARGMHHDGILYDAFLIGSGSAGDIAHRNGNSNIWNLDHNVYWPSSLEQVMFFAYTTLKTGESSESGVLDGAKFGFDTSKNPYIDEYQPKKADLTVKSDDEAAVWSDGNVQKDLLVAYTKQKRADNPTNVNLNFQHALTQISITARQKNKLSTDHRIVKIKGAWIVNAAQKGKLSADLNYNTTDKTTTDTKTWGNYTDKTTYGSFYNQIIQLDADTDIDLLRPENSDGKPGSLMLIPQDLTAWDKNDNNNGAYILLLCRVELVHQGATHTSTGDTNVDMSDIATDGTNHYHQLFPVNTTIYNGAEYGFVCVPLSSTWNTEGIGKHYTYNLDICGAATDAGLYPPTMSSDEINKLIPANSKVKVIGMDALQELKIVKDRPDGKNVGNPVLDRPIQFTVSVADWADPDKDWTPGNGNF